MIRSIAGARLLEDIESMIRRHGDLEWPAALLFFSLCFTVVRSVPDTQCYYDVNGKHPENVGTRVILSTENGTLGPERHSARSFLTQLQSFKHLR